MAGLLVLPLALLALVAGVVVAVLRQPPLVVPPAAHEEVASTHRRLVLLRLGALVAAAVAGVVVTSGAGGGLGGPGQVASAGPALAALVFLAGCCLAELTVRRAATRVRTASLAPRSVLEVLPRAHARAAAVALGAVAATLALGTALGDADDLGRAGRALATRCVDASGLEVSHLRGPWPGSFYALPVAAALTLAALLSAVTLVVVARRPVVSQDRALDAAMRRWSARDVLLGLTLASCATLVPVLLLMTAGLAGASCRPTGYGALALLCGALTVAACFGTAWAASGLLVRPTLVAMPTAHPREVAGR